MRVKFICFFLFFSTLPLLAQYIPDDDFFMLQFKPCFQDSIVGPLFKKVEKDPQLTSLSKQQFHDYLATTIQGLKLEPNKNGVFKLKLNFYLDAALCLNVLGEKDILLTIDQIKYFRERMDHFATFQPGQQRGVDQHCQAILYVEIVSGQLKSFRNVNFGFN